MEMILLAKLPKFVSPPHILLLGVVLKQGELLKEMGGGNYGWQIATGHHQKKDLP
jgi:hypothetical protein